MIGRRLQETAGPFIDATSGQMDHEENNDNSKASYVAINKLKS